MFSWVQLICWTSILAFFWVMLVVFPRFSVVVITRKFDSWNRHRNTFNPLLFSQLVFGTTVRSHDNISFWWSTLHNMDYHIVYILCYYYILLCILLHNIHFDNSHIDSRLITYKNLWVSSRIDNRLGIFVVPKLLIVGWMIQN